MIGLTSDEREEYEAWPILPCDETGKQRKARMNKSHAEWKTGERRQTKE
jgi:hypothetical protein